MTPRRLEGAADLVIEISSDSDPGLDLREKLPRYREALIEEIWLVNPFDRSVLAVTRRPAGYESRSLRSGKLSSLVLPEFWIDVSWLWEKELPAPVECSRKILGQI